MGKREAQQRAHARLRQTANCRAGPTLHNPPSHG
jgi:hypothetical protein